jgi:hypothetical protein
MSTPPQRRHLHPLRVVAIAVVALASGAGVAYAATHTGRTIATDSSASQPAADPSPSASAPSPSASAPSKLPWPGGRMPGGFGRFGGIGGGLGFAGIGGFGGVLHGQFTVPKASGGYQTEDVQRGTVTAVSSSSITVKSADGYSATYVVTSTTEVNAQAAGIGAVKVGDTVSLTATVSQGTATAASIFDLTSIKASRGAFFGFPVGPPAGNPN